MKTTQDFIYDLKEGNYIRNIETNMITEFQRIDGNEAVCLNFSHKPRQLNETRLERVKFKGLAPIILSQKLITAIGIKNFGNGKYFFDLIPEDFKLHLRVSDTGFILSDSNDPSKDIEVKYLNEVQSLYHERFNMDFPIPINPLIFSVFPEYENS